MEYQITHIDVNSKFESCFTERATELFELSGMFISQRQEVLNFRYRKSLPNYKSDWHVAGDPTFIVVQSGCIEIELRNGQKKQFCAGEAFVAADYLPKNIMFSEQHGHRARVIGNDEFVAIHFKLSLKNEG
ncbi:hypothetical protein [Glaciecola petra]|uniref:Uncharacterized protein n=1 Tax=Glaciecola petra TaxID=3075602 RepID=A0ABU2ZUT4_9ALTE|nr:hypothetical protein [Aestuariibacter sp. P117]MDT0596401.1 hypothetical protein [Aestuariibacter sp. P117]